MGNSDPLVSGGDLSPTPCALGKLLIREDYEAHPFSKACLSPLAQRSRNASPCMARSVRPSLAGDFDHWLHRGNGCSPVAEHSRLHAAAFDQHDEVVSPARRHLSITTGSFKDLEVSGIQALETEVDVNASLPPVTRPSRFAAGLSH